MSESKSISPVVAVDDVVVIGERHREYISRDIFHNAWDTYEFDAVCVEVAPDIGLRDDGGGAIGAALTAAESSNIPRFYVDVPNDDIIDAFNGSRLRAYNYLKNVDKNGEVLSKDSVNLEKVNQIRTDFLEEYGQSSYETLFTDREELMASRAKWVSNQVDGKVALVVGSGHLKHIVELLEGDVNPISMDSSRVHRGSRKYANMGPWTLAITFMFESISNLGTEFKQWVSKKQKSD